MTDTVPAAEIATEPLAASLDITRGRPYMFTTEGATDGASIRALGTIWNRDGQDAGLVVELLPSGRREVMHGPHAHPMRLSIADRAALANLDTPHEHDCDLSDLDYHLWMCADTGCEPNTHRVCSMHSDPRWPR